MDNAVIAAREVIATCTRVGAWRDAPQNLLEPGFLSDVVGPVREQLSLEPDELELLLWSSVYHRHADVAFWAGRCGAELAARVIADKLGSSNARFRRGAAFAAGALASRDDAISQALLDLTLTDADAEVRREAALALYRAGSSSAVAALVRAHRDPKRRRQALEALARFHVSGATLADVPLWLRLRIRRSARRNVRAENRLLMGDAGLTGLKAGMLSACAWLFTVASVYALLYGLWRRGYAEGSVVTIFVIALLVFLGPCLGIGVPLAYFVSRNAAVDVLIKSRTSFLSATCGSYPYLGATLACGFAWSAFWVHTWRSPMTMLAWFPGSFWLLTTVTIVTAGPYVASARRAMSLIARAVLASAGLPILITTLVAFEILGRLAGDDGITDPDSGFIVLTSIPMSSGLAAVLCSAVGRVFSEHGQALGWTGAASSMTPALARARAFAFPMLAVGALALMLFELGPRTVPWGLSDGRLVAGGPPLVISAHLRSGNVMTRVERRRFHVEGAENEYLMLEVRDQSAPAMLDGDGFSNNHPAPPLLRAGAHEFLIHQEEPNWTVTLVPKARLLIGAAPATSAGRSALWAEWKTPSKKTDVSAGGTVRLATTIRGRSHGAAILMVDDGLYGYGALEPGRVDGVATWPDGNSIIMSGRKTWPAWLYCASMQFFRPYVVAGRADGTYEVQLDLFLPADSRLLAAPALRALVLVEDIKERLKRRGDSDVDRVAIGSTTHLGRARLDGVDLTGIVANDVVADFASLSNAVLKNTEFSSAALTYADLGGAELTGANFAKAKLRHAKLAGAHNGAAPESEPSHLHGISFRQADLSYADLSRVMFAAANFSGATFRQTNLSGARLLWVRELTDEQLSGACGTGTVTIQSASPPRVETIALPACTGEKDVRPDPPPLGACLKNTVAFPAAWVCADKLPGSGRYTGRAYRWEGGGVSSADGSYEPIACECELDKTFLETTIEGPPGRHPIPQAAVPD